MKKFLILVLVILEAEFVLAIDNNPLKANTTNQIEIQPEKGIEDQPLEKLLEDLKKRSIEKNIEIYYLEKTIKETIIQEAPKDEYLEHLLKALKDSLKKGKKTGKIRRVEKDLVEIDKGAIHKVRERDIYKVYDSSTGAYKGKLEVQAIADAVSIGQNYNLKGSSLSVNDVIKYLGNRKYMEFGIMLRIVRGGGGIFWRYNVFGDWGFELAFHRMSLQEQQAGLDIRYSFVEMSVGVKKYFNFPSMYCPYIGVNVFPGYKIIAYENYNYIYEKDEGAVCAILVGMQLFSCRTIHIDFEIKHLFVPTTIINSNTIELNPLIAAGSISMSW